MIAEWMLYASALGALIAGAAAALDRVAAARGSATRWLWLGAVVVTLLAPAALALRRPAPPALVARLAAGRGPAAAPRAAAGAPAAPVAGAGGASWRGLDLARLDRPLLIAWAGVSVALALLLAGGTMARWRASRRWAAHDLDGTRVLVAPDAGPLVSGWWRLTIVLPHWVLVRTEAERRMMLAHEAEHRRMRDPNLLLVSALAVTANPWNPALWWQLRRLRLAIETDCDRRVLRSGVDVHGYGNLLLDVGERAARRLVPAGAAFAETPSLLERRLDAMTAAPPRHPVARALALGTLAAGALLVACVAPRPAPLRPAGATGSELFPNLESQVDRPAPEPMPTKDAMTAAIDRYFPEVLRGDTSGGLPIAFVLDARGKVVSTSRGTSGRPVVPFARLAYGVLESAPAGYYGPSPVRTEVLWLKPDSMADTARGFGFVTRTIGRPDTAAARPPGPSFEDEARGWLRARPGLLPAMGAADTAYVWFVLDARRQPLRAGVAASMRDAPRAAGIEGMVGWAGYRETFKPGVLAAGTVVAVAWSHF